jgi:hypothetical protein
MQRDVINEVMRGQMTPEAGLAKMVNETKAITK